MFSPHFHLPHIISVFSVALCCATVSVCSPISAGFVRGPAVPINRVQLSIYLRKKNQSSISLTLLALFILSVASCGLYLMSLFGVFSFVTFYLFSYMLFWCCCRRLYAVVPAQLQYVKEMNYYYYYYYHHHHYYHHHLLYAEYLYLHS